jgi:hypothetical protein
MHEKDHLDQMLESSLSSYGDPGADTGLAERILARVSSEKKLKESTSGWRNRLLLWTALSAAACLLLGLFVWKTAGPSAIPPSTHQPNVASVTPKSQAPNIAIVVPAKRIPTHTVPRTASRPAVAVTGSATRPKLDVFPQPQPLSSEEQALYAFATQVPEEQRRAVMTARKNDDAPLNIAAISIQPLEVLDTGKN